MKKVLIALLVAAPLVAFAQPDQDRHQERAFERMEKTLELNEQQKEKATAIFSQHREQMQALRESTHSKVNAILNDEQRGKLANMHEQRREKMEQWKSENGKDGKGKDMKKKGRKDKSEDKGNS